MIRELLQNTLFIKRKTTIFENRVSWLNSKFGNGTEVNIAYEDLTNFKEFHVISQPSFLIASLILGFVTFVTFISRNDKDFDPYTWIIFGIMFLISSSIYLVTREKVWKIKLHNLTYLFLSINTPDKITVDEFIDELFRARNRYLRDTYFYIDKNMQYETQLKNLQWLRKVDAITKDEFEVKRKELGDLFNSEKKAIGFSNK